MKIKYVVAILTKDKWLNALALVREGTEDIFVRTGGEMAWMSDVKVAEKVEEFKGFIKFLEQHDVECVGKDILKDLKYGYQD